MKKRNFNKSKLIIILLVILSIGGLCYSAFNIIKWKLDNVKVEKIENNIRDKIRIEESVINELELEEKSILDNYIIDFEELKKINSEIVGYIKVDNTDIDTTIVKHHDNDYYLNHAFDKSWNLAGWVFADYKNKFDGTDRNYVVFGHARKDGSMFGTLKNILTEEWQDKDSNIIFITENNKYLLKTFSIYKIKAEDYYITTNFNNDIEFDNFINTIKSRSLKDFNIDVNSDDTILTLSTCYTNNKYRIVLHAKIVEMK